MKKRFDEQVCLKLAGPLRAVLDAEAAADGRNLSSLIRKILIDHAARRITAPRTEAA